MVSGWLSLWLIAHSGESQLPCEDTPAVLRGGPCNGELSPPAYSQWGGEAFCQQLVSHLGSRSSNAFQPSNYCNLGQPDRPSWWFWLRVFHEVAVKILEDSFSYSRPAVALLPCGRHCARNWRAKWGILVFQELTASKRVSLNNHWT